MQSTVLREEKGVYTKLLSPRLRNCHRQATYLLITKNTDDQELLEQQQQINKNNTLLTSYRLQAEGLQATGSMLLATGYIIIIIIIIISIIA